MYHLPGKIRDYNPTTDTATVEFDGIGVIDVWFDGLTIDPSLNRAFLTHGAPVTVAAPDVTRLCEGSVSALANTVNAPLATSGGSVTRTQTGRASVATDATGAGSRAQVFGVAYSAIPTITLMADEAYSIAVSSVSATGFTAAITGAPSDGFVFFTWQAVGV